jgi:hypothetical protein
MNLNKSKALFGLPIPIEPEKRSLVMEIGWNLRCDIVDFAQILRRDSDPMLQALGNILSNRALELMQDLAMRKR